jgi:hypothetical protein
MRILFDQGAPVPLRSHLPAHEIETTAERGSSDLSNGDLLDEAERAGFEAIITRDQNLRHQQNLTRRALGILVLTRASWPRIVRRVSEVQSAVDQLRAGDYVEIEI